MSEVLWKEYCNSTDDDTRNRARILKWLVEGVDKDQFDLQFVYGVRSDVCPMKPSDPVDALITLIASVLQWQWKDGRPWARSKPTVIVNLDTFIFNTSEYPSLKYIKDVFAGGPVHQETVAGDDRSKKYRGAYFAELKASERIKLHNGGTVDEVKGYAPWLTGGKDHVLFLQLGAVPPPLFDFTFAKSTLPQVFEGMGTANLALTLGKWYFHVARPNVYDVLYPSTTVKFDEAKTPKKFQLAANNVRKSLDFASALGWPKFWESGDNEDIGPAEIAAFMQLFVSEEGVDLQKFLVAVREFYGDPNNGKLRMAINYLNHIYKVPGANLALTTAEKITTLEQLYAALEKELQTSGKAPMAPGILQELGDIGVYYDDLVKGLKTEFILDSPKLEKNPEKEIQWIKLSGETAAPLGPTDSQEGVIAKLEFTAPNNKIRLNAEYLEKSNYVLKNIPWIPVKEPFNQLVSSDGLPVVGTVGATLTGIDLKLGFRFPAVDNKWLFTGTFEDPPGIESLFSLMGGINALDVLHGPFKTLTALKAKEFQLLYDTEAKSVNSISTTVGTTEKVTLLQGLDLDSLQAKVIIIAPADLKSRTTQVILSSQFKIGDKPDSGVIQVGANFPEVAVNGQLISGVIRLEALLGLFLPGVPLSLPSVPTIDAFLFSYNAQTKAYSVSCNFNIDWPISIGGTDVFTIQNAAFLVNGTENGRTGYVSGSVVILPNDPDVNLGLTVSATYLGTNLGWVFEGRQTSGQIPLGKIISHYLGWQTSQSYGIDGLKLTISTADHSWLFTGKTAQPWQVPFIPELSVKANLTTGYNGEKKTAFLLPEAFDSSFALVEGGDKVPGPFARLETDWTWENIEMIVWFDYNPKVKSFGVTLPDLHLEAQVEQNAKKEWIGTLRFTESTTLGTIVEMMVGWATGSKFGLASPWSILNSIPLDKLALVYNFTQKQVSLDINIGPIELGFARIEAIGLTYKSNQPNPDDNGVQVELKGGFLWQDDPTKPLGWDASKPETTKAPDGQGNKYLDLRLLALGQHVTLAGYKDANSVQDVIKAMRTLPTPDKDNITIPEVVLDPNSSWLIGMDFGILRFGGEDDKKGGTAVVRKTADEKSPSGYLITMQIVFNDPNLYALRIKLDGDAAKSSQRARLPNPLQED